MPPSRTALIVAFATIYLVWGSTYLGIRVAVCLGWLILREPVTSRTLVASAVIVTAVALITVQKTRTAPVLSAPAAPAPTPQREAA
jgi:drug/metabolite transporter (DMT)-like permease